MKQKSWSEQVSELNPKAMLSRKRGDALRRTGDREEAMAAYRIGLKSVEDILMLLKNPQWNQLEQYNDVAALPAEQLAIARELTEALGSRGGFLRRLGQVQEALNSYRQGTEIEEKFNPKSTYNRVNAVKFSLLFGLNKLDEIKHDIEKLERMLSEQLTTDQELSDSGWAWADLGDCRALLGDVQGAERAYRTFTEKARSNAPITTLDVLREILVKLEESNDPKAMAVKKSLIALEQRLV